MQGRANGVLLSAINIERDADRGATLAIETAKIRLCCLPGRAQAWLVVLGSMKMHARLATEPFKRPLVFGRRWVDLPLRGWD